MKTNEKYIAFNKPYGCLCQFTGEEGALTLSAFGLPKNVYAAGRLDKDSEGLLILTSDGVFNQRVTNPKSNKEKTYWVQVERVPDNESLKKLQRGVIIKSGKTLPCSARLIDPEIDPRDPPVRFRKNVPTAWLEIKLSEGKNRQVRRMTAAIGHPTLRLIRVAIGKCQLGELAPGAYKEISPKDVI